MALSKSCGRGWQNRKNTAHTHEHLTRPLGLPGQGYAQRDRAIAAFVKVGKTMGWW